MCDACPGHDLLSRGADVDHRLRGERVCAQRGESREVRMGVKVE